MRSSSRQRPQPCPIGTLPGGVEGADEWIRCERDPGRYDVARRYPAHRMKRADIGLVVLEHETVLAFEGIQQVGQERLIPPMIATMSARRVEDPGVQGRVDYDRRPGGGVETGDVCRVCGKSESLHARQGKAPGQHVPVRLRQAKVEYDDSAVARMPLCAQQQLEKRPGIGVVGGGDDNRDANKVPYRSSNRNLEVACACQIPNA